MRFYNLLDQFLKPYYIDLCLKGAGIPQQYINMLATTLIEEFAFATSGWLIALYFLIGLLLTVTLMNYRLTEQKMLNFRAMLIPDNNVIFSLHSLIDPPLVSYRFCYFFGRQYAGILQTICRHFFSFHAGSLQTLGQIICRHATAYFLQILCRLLADILQTFCRFFNHFCQIVCRQFTDSSMVFCRYFALSIAPIISSENVIML